MIDWTAFETFIAGHYSTETAKKARRQMVRWARGDTELEGLPRRLHEDLYRHWSYLTWWARETGTTLPRRLKRVPPPPTAETGPRRRRKKERKAPILPIAAGPWGRLRASVLDDPHPAAAVIDLMMSTNLRVGDVLRIEAADVARGAEREDGMLLIVVKGGKKVPHSMQGAPRAWARMRELMASDGGANVAACVTRSGSEDHTTDGAAYKAVNRRWKEHARSCRLQGAANLHRIRHTVTTRIMVQEGTLEAARRAGVHDDAKTTRKYTAYAEAQLNAEALRSMNKEDDNA